ncbi:MAG: helix-turn-helix transcriptional regulator [Clostridia bacterium]|nr:helix-turn-helix transcriptional regulator [Clostridia bacterium]
MPHHGFVITGFVTLFEAHDPAGRKTDFFDRRSSCFIVTTKGRIRFTSLQGTVVADRDHPVFLPKGLSYTNECLETAESYVFNFQTLQQYDTPLSLHAISPTAAKDYYTRMLTKTFSSAPKDTPAVFELLYSLAGALFGASEESVCAHPVIRQALAWMHQYYGAVGITMADVARHCCVSEIYLRKLFQKQLHTTPFRRLTQIRMQQAKLLLEEKRKPGEVALRVGYADLYQFSRAYKRYFGYPPSQT